MILDGGVEQLSSNAKTRRDTLRTKSGGVRRELIKKMDKKGVILEGSEEPANLDEIRGISKDISLKEIRKHAINGLSRVDYVKTFASAAVVRCSDAVYPPSSVKPGQHLLLKGFVAVRLKIGIIPQAVTLEYVAEVATMNEY